jgi:hypothetical protein
MFRSLLRHARTALPIATIALVPTVGLATAGPAAAHESPAPVRVWDRVAECESGGDWHANTGNGYYGGLQFDDGTWDAFGGEHFAHKAHRASKSEQIHVAQKVLVAQGWEAWPACSAKLGLR